jgi:hypothetical protein
MEDLQAHRIQSRNLSGDAADENLITICVRCHHSTCEGWFNSLAGLSYSFLLLSSEIVPQDLSASFSLKGFLHGR